MQYRLLVYFNYVTRLYDLVYIKLLYEPGRKGACPEDWIMQQITQCTHVQTHMQSTGGQIRRNAHQWKGTTGHGNQ